MRILITGAGGQLGRDLVRELEPHDVVPLSRAALDVTDGASVAAAVRNARPEIVIHCAALTDTARCERDPAAARAVNVDGTEHVAMSCARARIRLVAVSTNEVFDGAKASPYDEDGVPRAINAYGASKLEGERAALETHPGTLIVRTSWTYGGGDDNFVMKVMHAARSGRELRFVTDETATPTSTQDLASAIGALIDAGAPGGIYHLANEGKASRYEWAREIVRLAAIDARIDPVTTAQLRTAGYDGPQKPAYSVLANTRARSLGVVLRPWQDALAARFARPQVAADA